MWQYAAMAGVNLIATSMQAKEQMKAEAEHNRLRYEQARLETNRETESTLQNINSIKRQEVSDLANIELAALRAKDEAVMARAGSGISGASMDDIDAEILIEVSKDQVQATRAANDAVSNQMRGLQQANENRVIEGQQRKMNTDPRKMLRNSLLSSAGTALGNADFSSFRTPDPKPIKKGK